MNIAHADLVAAVQADRMREAARRHRAELAATRPRRRGFVRGRR